MRQSCVVSVATADSILQTHDRYDTTFDSGNRAFVIAEVSPFSYRHYARILRLFWSKYTVSSSSSRVSAYSLISPLISYNFVRVCAHFRFSEVSVYFLQLRSLFCVLVTLVTLTIYSGHAHIFPHWTLAHQVRVFL